MLTRALHRSGRSVSLAAFVLASAFPAVVSASHALDQSGGAAKPAAEKPTSGSPATGKQSSAPAAPAKGSDASGGSGGAAPAGQATSGQDGAKPSLPEGKVVVAGAPDETLLKRPGDVIEPAAQTILDRAEKAAMDVSVLELVTEYQAKTFDGEAPAFGSVVAPQKVLMQYTRRDALSMPRMRVEAADPATGGLVIIFDGDGSAVLDLDRKLWTPTRAGFPEEAQIALASLPRWVIERRSKGFIKARNGGQLRPGGNEMVAARVIGTEVVDGEECDVVSCAIASRVFEDGAESQIDPGPTKYTRTFETVAIARVDGLPRRIHVVSEVPGRGPAGN
ncbi:MAG: hypothetical protein ACKO3W_06690, partial [bacterium]